MYNEEDFGLAHEDWVILSSLDSADTETTAQDGTSNDDSSSECSGEVYALLVAPAQPIPNLSGTKRSLLETVRPPDLVPYICRTKYIKKGTLTVEEKSELVKERNRLNAKRARQRKLLYSQYLLQIKSLNDTESVASKDHTSEEEKKRLGNKFEKVLQLMHVTRFGTLGDWLELCALGAVHRSPLSCEKEEACIATLQGHVFANARLLDLILEQEGLNLSHVWRTTVTANTTGISRITDTLFMAMEYDINIELVPHKLFFRKSNVKTARSAQAKVHGIMSGSVNDAGFVDLIEEHYNMDPFRLVVHAVKVEQEKKAVKNASMKC